MGDMMMLRGREEIDMNSWDSWVDVLDEPSLLADNNRCHDLDAEDVLHYGHNPAQQTLLQPAPSTKQKQREQEQSSALLQSLESYLASNRTSEHPPESLLQGTYDELAMDCSSASSQSYDSLVSLMLGTGALPCPQSIPVSPTASAAPPNIPTCDPPEASRAACAEQASRGSEGLCPEEGNEPADSMLDDMCMQIAYSDSSAECFGSAHTQPFGVEPFTLQKVMQPAPTPNRKRGRPRRYDTTLPLGMMDGHVAAGAAIVNGMQPGVRKRGAKPKYNFMTAEEAVAHRRERNRSTAIATHERKKAHKAALKAELSMRQGEHDALQRLLKYVQQPKADKEMIRKLLLGEEGAEASICDAMEYLLTAGE